LQKGCFIEILSLYLSINKKRDIMNSSNVERLISLLTLLKAHGIDTDALSFDEAVDFLVQVDNTIKRVKAEQKSS
jgi:hypothetical protein